MADGPVNATVLLHGTKGSGQTFHAVPSWVLCGPPDFAPAVRNVVTLYDTLLANAVRNGSIVLPPKPSFAFDIYRLIEAALNQKWVHDITGGHGFASLLQPNSNLAARQALFKKLKPPTGSGGGNMPLLLKDDGGPSLAVTQVQFDTLKIMDDRHNPKERCSRAGSPAACWHHSGRDGPSRAAVIGRWRTVSRN